MREREEIFSTYSRPKFALKVKVTFSNFKNVLEKISNDNVHIRSAIWGKNGKT